MRRSLTVLALIPAATLLTGIAFANATDAELKGARAVLVDGKQLDAQVRILGLDATWVFIDLMRSINDASSRVGAPPAADARRVCFRVSVVLPRRDLESVPDSELTVKHADFTYWFYPAAGEGEPVVVAGGAAYRPIEGALVVLKRSGVPDRLDPTPNAACERPAASGGSWLP